MGNWTITIQGTGGLASGEDEVQQGLRELVQKLKAAGNNIESAYYTHGARYDGSKSPNPQPHKGPPPPTPNPGAEQQDAKPEQKTPAHPETSTQHGQSGGPPKAKP